VSVEEWKVFRHFWSPTYVSKTGPSKMPADGRPIAEGPLGGLFIDGSFLAIWQTNMINMMLEYYLDKRSLVLTSARTLLLSLRMQSPFCILLRVSADLCPCLMLQHVAISATVIF